MKLICAILFMSAALLRAEVTLVSITPSKTDANIKTFDHSHWIYVNRDIVVDHREDVAHDRHQLYLFIPGTHEKDMPRGKGPAAFCNLAADLGYHVIVLAYPDETAAAVCRYDDDPNAFEDFRMALIRGGKSKHITIERSESIENRLVKLLQHLQEIRPKEDWGQFLTGKGEIRWENVAIGGQSQGGGHAALMAIKHKVARVVCTGSPKDFDHIRNQSAAYYSEKSATPKDRFFTFNHEQDYIVDTSPEQLRANLKALGLDRFGKVVDVDTSAPPYNHSRILFTSYPKLTATGPESKGSHNAHLAMLNAKNAEHWKDVWTYLLTEKVEE